MIHSTSPTDKKKKNHINLHFNHSKKVTRKSKVLVHPPVSNFSPFHLGRLLCITRLLSPLLQLILQN